LLSLDAVFSGELVHLAVQNFSFVTFVFVQVKSIFALVANLLTQGGYFFILHTVLYVFFLANFIDRYEPLYAQLAFVLKSGDFAIR
jgi:hypothetical protein